MFQNFQTFSKEDMSDSCPNLFAVYFDAGFRQKFHINHSFFFQSLIPIQLMPCLRVLELRAYAKRTETVRKSTKTFKNRAEFKMDDVKWMHGKLLDEI